MDTKKLRQKILDLAIRGKLVPQDPNDEPASVLLERIRAEKEQLIKEGKIKRSKKSAASDTSHYENVPFEVPESWRWTTIEDLLINRDSERIPLSLAVRNKQHKKEYNYYGAAGVIDKVEGYLFSERLLLIGEDGANLLSRAKDNAFFADGKYWVNNHAHVLDCSEKEVLNYVALVINSMALDPYVTGSAQPKLSQDNLNKILIPLPPLAEQRRIIYAINNYSVYLSNIENDKKSIENIIDLLKQLILNLAITGKLVSQELNDEPAIELLKRINPSFVPADNRHYENVPKGWAVCTFEDILEYEQPQQYIVNSTDYSDEYEIPVLTAGKSFIIGRTDEKSGICKHLPVIIFDDFTTDSKYVDFPFKVKSSAMKILHAKGNVNPKYVAYLMSVTRLVGDTHKRYWISEYSKIPIMLPPVNEQERIVSLIEKIYDRLDKILAEL